MSRLHRPGHVSDHARLAWARHLDGAEDADQIVAALTEGTVPSAVAATAAAHGDRPALTVGDAAVTHGELDARVARAAGWLRARGVAPGDRVLLAGPSSLELVIAYLAILRAGAVMVPADPGSTARELAHLVSDSGATAAWASAPLRDHLGATGLALLAALEEEADGEPLAELPTDGAATAILAYTSGTTGAPKGVPLSHANLLASIRAAMAAWRWTRDDVLVHALPLSHQHGLSGVHATLLAGSRAIVLPRFDADRLCDTIRDSGATVLFAVPAIYERLMAAPRAVGADLRSLRLAVSGSAALPPGLAERLREALGTLPLERYGSTEAGLNLSNPYRGPRKAGSVGLPLPGVEVAVVDADGRETCAGEDGELVVRGPQVFAGYWRAPEATAAAFRDGGWFRTGDIARLDPIDGYVAITGRLKEMIVSGGLNVYPREVELVLEEDPAVARAVVVGAPSERWGEEVVAFVVVANGDGLDRDSLDRHVRDRLAPYKCPKRVIEIDELPVNRMGKVVRGELVKRLA
jgi:malonyl-CoA/methylmalonyl-CoA synthetase